MTTTKERAAMQQALEACKRNQSAQAQAILEEALAGHNMTPTEQAEQDHKCKDHPDAPHGFCRDESITQDRYVCECEFWEPPKTAEHPFEQTTLYAVPIRTKDLTDDEIQAAIPWVFANEHEIRLARAVIAADREKNK